MTAQTWKQIKVSVSCSLGMIYISLTLTGISSDAGIKGELVGTGAFRLGDVATDKKNGKLPINAHTAPHKLI